MTESTEEFAVLMQRLREGSEDAARELLERYGDHVIRAVRRRLHKSLRTRFDSQDFTQAVWASFFGSRDLLSQLGGPDDLVALLVQVANHKVADGYRRHLKLSPDSPLRKETRLGGSQDAWEKVAAKLPTPSETAVGNEVQDQLRELLPLHYQRMIKLRSDGATYAEIAAELGVDKGTVNRILSRLKEQFEA